jgi:hypothetical protein
VLSFVELPPDLDEESEGACHEDPQELQLPEDDLDIYTPSSTIKPSDAEFQPFGDSLRLPQRPASFDPYKRIRDDLLKGYQKPSKPSEPPGKKRILSQLEMDSLMIFYSWARTNGTIDNYKVMRALKSTPEHEILSLHQVRKLALDVTGVEPQLHDMCPLSHMGFTGSDEHLQSCTYNLGSAKNPIICGEPRYNTKGLARKQFITLSPIHRLKALHKNPRTSKLLRSRAQAYAAACRRIAEECIHYRDFPDGEVHRHQIEQLGRFQHEADGAFVLAVDGAQLKMGKKGGAWFVQLTFLHLPLESGRLTQEYTMVLGMFPGPNSPANFSSFMRPIYVELARLSEGIWVDDAVDNNWIEVHGDLVAEAGDAPGQQKLHLHTGHRGRFGDLYSYVRALKLRDGSNDFAWTLRTPEAYSPGTNTRTALNALRPTSYDGLNLPCRTEDDYLNILYLIENETFPTRRASLATQTGVIGPATGSFSPSFVYNGFWPLDPMHQVCFHTNIQMRLFY